MLKYQGRLQLFIRAVLHYVDQDQVTTRNWKCIHHIALCKSLARYQFPAGRWTSHIVKHK